jgi:hypothetical protein
MESGKVFPHETTLDVSNPRLRWNGLFQVLLAQVKLIRNEFDDPSFNQGS